jgi:hypothetical protein
VTIAATSASLDVVEGKLTLSAEDLDRAAAQMPENVRMRRSLSLYGVVLVLFGVAGGGLTHAALAPRLIWVAFGVGLIVYAQLRRSGQGRRLIAAMKQAEREVSYRFDAHGVNITTPVSDVSLQYAALHHQIESDTAFLLYMKERVAQIVPKRAFDAGGLDQIRRWLGVQVKARPASRKLGRLFLIWIVLAATFLVTWYLLVRR